jgi:hypothetical protein
MIKVFSSNSEIAAININKIYLYLGLFVILLYIFPIAALLAPKLRNGLIYIFYPIPFFLLFFVPGMVFSRVMEVKLTKIGYDRAIKVAKIFSDIKWTGIGIFLFFVVITIWWHYAGVSDQLPIIVD